MSPTTEPAKDPKDDARDGRRVRLEELRAKGWAKLTPEEREEATAIQFDLKIG